MENSKKQILLSKLPSVDHLIELIKEDKRFKKIPFSISKSAIRNGLENFRKNILSKESVDLSDNTILTAVF